MPLDRIRRSTDIRITIIRTHEENPMSEETEIKVEEAPAKPPRSKSPAPRKAKSEKTEPAQTEAASLREQLGGDEAIQNAVEILTEKLMADPRINHFMFGVSRADQGGKHKSFLTVALRGENDGTEGGDLPDLHKAFAQFFDKGFKDRHFDVIFHHLRESLKEMNIADELSDAVIKASDTLRNSLFSK
jgi:hemoglobin